MTYSILGELGSEREIFNSSEMCFKVDVMFHEEPREALF